MVTLELVSAPSGTLQLGELVAKPEACSRDKVYTEFLFSLVFLGLFGVYFCVFSEEGKAVI